MINDKEILETLHMIENEHLDVRTITMGISLFDCCDPDPKAACRKIVDKICSKAEHLVRTGEEIEKEYGIPIINKRISVTPMAMIAAASKTDDLLCQSHAGSRRPLRRQFHRRFFRIGT